MGKKTKSKPLADTEEQADTAGGRFYEGNVIPTSMDLDPYYGAQRENGVIDFGATCIGNVAWLTEGDGEGKGAKAKENTKAKRTHFLVKNILKKQRSG